MDDTKTHKNKNLKTNNNTKMKTPQRNTHKHKHITTKQTKNKLDEPNDTNKTTNIK